MPIVNAFSKALVRDFSLEELKQAARLMRGYDLVALCAAGSGHAGGTLSMMEIVAALYLKVANHDPNVPEWDDRDRIVWSGGHKAPALYLGLGMAGYYPLEDVVTLRKLYSPFQGHPHRLKLPGVEVSSGSLGQGLSIAVGMALVGKIEDKKHTVFCIMGDGEQQEGSIWEAVMEGSHYKLDNLVGIIDRNRLQIDGWVKEVMNVEPLEERYRGFGWEVIEADGHDIKQVVEALQKAKNTPTAGKPTVVICNTVKGKGVSFMENVAGWHGKAPSYDEMVKGLEELGLKNNIAYDALLRKASEYQKKVEAKLDAKMPHFSRDYWWNAEGTPKVEMEPTTKGFGKSLASNGDDERIVCSRLLERVCHLGSGRRRILHRNCRPGDNGIGRCYSICSTAMRCVGSDRLCRDRLDRGRRHYWHRWCRIWNIGGLSVSIGQRGVGAEAGEVEGVGSGEVNKQQGEHH